MWDVVMYLFYLSLVFLMFSLIWWVASFIFAISTVALKMESTFTSFSFKALGTFLLSCFTAAYALGTKVNHGLGFSILIYIIGATFLLLQIGNGIVDREKEARQSGDYNAIVAMQYDSYLLPVGLIAYILGLIFPAISLNQLTLWVFGLMEKVWAIPYLPIILGIVAVIYVLNFAFTGVIALGALGYSLFSKSADENNTEEL